MPAAHRITAPSIAAGFLAVVVALAVVFPAAVVVIRMAAGAAAGGFSIGEVVPDVRLLIRTSSAVLSIAALATILAWPAAWAARAWPSRRLLILLAPMLLPSYLAYSGWGLLRAPGTWLGDIIIRGPQGAAPGENWWPIAALYIQAIAGLVFWSWPLAAIILAAHLRQLDRDVLDALRLEAGRTRRFMNILAMTRSGTFLAFGAVVLVMLGSAIPLHVAQLETYSMFIWRRLTELPHSEQWRTWVAAWPLLAIAILAAIIIARWVDSMTAGSLPALRHRPVTRASIMALVFTIGLWTLSIVVPAILFAASLRSPRSLTRFWQMSWESLAASAAIAAGVATIGLLMIVAVWLAVSSGPCWRRLVLIFTTILLAAGLAPGILLGAATAGAWSELTALWPAASHIVDSPAILVIGHVARFGFIGALVGHFLAAAEPRDLRNIRLLDAGPSFRGFVVAALPPQIGTVLAASLAIGLLSFHEIEAAVLLQPPSAIGGGLPWQMLQWLHFARMEDLSAAVLCVLAAAILMLLAVAAAARLRIGPAGR
jgi:ABC-type Fe3+ transport system permease subunit